MSETNYEHLDGTVLRETEMAVLVEVGAGLYARDVWIPRSVIEYGDAVSEKDKGLYVADWFCEKNDLT